MLPDMVGTGGVEEAVCVEHAADAAAGFLEFVRAVGNEGAS